MSDVFGVQIRKKDDSRLSNKVWNNLKNAKLAVCPTSLWGVKKFTDFKRRYKDELDSRFVIMYEDGTKEMQSVLDYYIDYFERQNRNYEPYNIILKGLEEYKNEKS